MIVYVDVIVPVHNAEETIVETVESAMRQCIPGPLLLPTTPYTKVPREKQQGEEEDGNASDNMCYYLDYYQRTSLQETALLDVAVCCYDDGSTDKSFEILKSLEAKYQKQQVTSGNEKVKSKLIVGQSEDGIGRGAGYARNQAASLRRHHEYQQEKCGDSQSFICLLDSDDVMHQHRIAEQISVMLHMSANEQNRTIIGCTFRRIPHDSTWHYTNWANNLTDERLLLERFREVTILQPTWMLTRDRFETLGGYIEAPVQQIDQEFSKQKKQTNSENGNLYKLIHPLYDTPQTLRLAEDLRFFHAHLLFKDYKNDDLGGILKLIRTKEPLLLYRHRIGQSQSSNTSRKLLLQLRTKAFTDTILLQPQSLPSSPSLNNWLYCKERNEGGFVIWGAGRDGKEFFKSLPNDMKENVRCFVDVDEKKINSGYYVVPFLPSSTGTSTGTGQETNTTSSQTKKASKDKRCSLLLKVPIVHYSLLTKDDVKRELLMNEWMYPDASILMEEKAGQISKDKPKKKAKIDHIDSQSKSQSTTQQIVRKLHALSKRDKPNHDLLQQLKHLPVVVCVAMYRSNNALERNVNKIGRKEGIDLWHFS